MWLPRQGRPARRLRPEAELGHDETPPSPRRTPAQPRRRRSRPGGGRGRGSRHSPTFEAEPVPWGDGGGTTWAKIGRPPDLPPHPTESDSTSPTAATIGSAFSARRVGRGSSTCGVVRRAARGRGSSTIRAGVAVDPWGTVVVADTGNERIPTDCVGRHVPRQYRPSRGGRRRNRLGRLDLRPLAVLHTVVWMTSTGKRIAAWQAILPVAAEPLEARGATRRRKHEAADDGASRRIHALGHHGRPRRHGDRDRKSQARDIVRLRRGVGAAPQEEPLHGERSDDPARVRLGVRPRRRARLLAATDLTRENRRALGEGSEACWRTWDGNGDAGSLVVGPIGQVVAGVRSPTCGREPWRLAPPRPSASAGTSATPTPSGKAGADPCASRSPAGATCSPPPSGRDTCSSTPGKATRCPGGQREASEVDGRNRLAGARAEWPQRDRDGRRAPVRAAASSWASSRHDAARRAGACSRR